MSSPSSKAKYASRQHRTLRSRLAAEVDAGRAWCAETICVEERDGRTRWIAPGTAWDLAHADDGRTYKGPAHARCNRADGARRGNATRMASGNVTVVAGPPCAGKTTWVNEQMSPGDVVVDYDQIATALGAPHRLDLTTVEHPAIRQAARDARAAVIAAAKRGKYGTAHVWVIQAWAGDWPQGIEVTTIDPGPETCHARATADGRPQSTHGVIDQWYAAHSTVHEYASRRVL